MFCLVAIGKQKDILTENVALLIISDCNLQE